MKSYAQFEHSEIKVGFFSKLLSYTYGFGHTAHSYSVKPVPISVFLYRLTPEQFSSIDLADKWEKFFLCMNFLNRKVGMSFQEQCSCDHWLWSCKSLLRLKASDRPIYCHPYPRSSCFLSGSPPLSLSVCLFVVCQPSPSFMSKHC